MGAHSTLAITRSKAREVMLERLMENDPIIKARKAEIMVTVQQADDNTLERLMDEVLDERLYNAIIVDDDEANEDRVV